MAIKTINDLDDASLPILGTDKIIISRDGLNVTKTDLNNLQSLSGIWLSKFYTSSSTTDDEAFAAALNFCSVNRTDLNIGPKPNGDAYIITTGLYWNFKRHSIYGRGDVKIQVSPSTSYSNGVVLNLVSDTNSSNNLWHSITHEFKGIALYGKPGWKFCEVKGENDSHSPALNFSNLYINEFEVGFEIGNNTWIHYYNRIFFRNSDVQGKALIINKTTNAGENLVVNSCTFSGQNGTALSIVSGFVEIHYKSCSFDYLAKILDYKVSYREKIVYEKCHFEDNGILQFDVSSESSPLYITFDTCDWYYTGASTQVRTNLGKFFSTNPNSKVIVQNCYFPFNENTQNSSLSNLFDVSSNVTSLVSISASGNTIEHVVNKYQKRISRKLSKAPPLSITNISSTENGAFYYFTTSSSGTFTTSSDVPTITNTNLGEGTTNIIVDTPTILITGISGLKCKFSYDQNNRVQLSGMFKRSHNYAFRVNFYSLLGSLLGSTNFSAPGTIGSWDTFGQEIFPVQGTESIEFEMYSITTGGTGVNASSTLYLNDLQYIQY